MTTVVAWVSGVYHLPAMCHVYEVIITSWALECLLPFFKSPLEVFYICHTLARGSGYLSRYSDWLGTVRGSNPGGGEIFRTCPDRPWGPPSLLYNGHRVFPGGKERPGRDADPSPPSSAVGHERVELYLYSPYGPYGLYRVSVPVQG